MSIVEAKEKNFLGKERDRRTDDLLELTEVLFLVLNRTRGVFFVLFCFLVVLEFGLRALCLLDKHTTTLAAPLALLLLLGTCPTRSCVFCLGLALDCDLPTYASSVAGIIGTYLVQHFGLFVEIGVSTGLSLNHNPPSLCLLSCWDCRYTIMTDLIDFFNWCVLNCT
jgi:hypothetical protein